ncbi:MAG: dihydrolipoamide acetyltransferase family protein [Dehalococcoidia bacterium]
MATAVLIPKLGMSMTEGTLAEWLVPDGSRVEKGQVIYYLVTEKIECEIEAEEAGQLRQLVAPDTILPAGSVVGWILAQGEEPPQEYAAAAETVAASTSAAASASPAAPAAAAEAAGADFVRASPAARRLARELEVDLAAVTGSGPEGRITEDDVRRHTQAGAPAPGAQILASPLAKRLAQEYGIDLATLQGTGPGGRIVQEDVERATAAKAAPAPEVTAAPEALAAPQAGTAIPFKGMRRTIAQRLHQSLLEMAQLTLAMEVDMTEPVNMLSQIRDEWRRQGLHLTYTDLIVKATATALTEHPRLNATLEGEVIRLLPEIDIGVAVALDEGLIVPVVRRANKKSLQEIGTIVHDLAERARQGKLTVDDVTGATFSITTLGMYDVDIFTPIINPPQAAILGVGKIKEVPAFQEGQVVRRSIMNLSLSFDHRLVDGAPAADFLRRIKRLLERPYLLLL